MSKAQSLKKPILLWALATFFFAFQFILRLSIGILREEIIQKFSIDTIAFGTLAGYYYLGYAGMQIPIGILLDRYSFNIVTFMSIALASIGTLTFVVATEWHFILIGRFMIGAGSAIGFLSVAKVTKTYFPPKYHAIMLGFSFSFGLTGAVFGATPMKMLFDHFGYYYTFYTLAFTGFAISLMMLLVNTKSIDLQDDSDGNSLSYYHIFKLIFNPTILLIGISGGFMVGSLEGFADLWSISFFKDVYKMSPIDSTTITSFVYIGMCFGGPVLTIFSEFFKSSYFMIFLTGLFTIVIFLILFYSSTISFFSASALMFLLGIFCCYQVLVFNITGNLVHKNHGAIAIAIVNCINMSFGHLFHKAISILIEYNWDGVLNDSGLPIYNRGDFIMGIGIIPVACFSGMLGFIYLSLKTRSSERVD